MSEALLTIDGATKRFGGLVAVSDVSFSVGAGDLISIIGPNGAGKTTLFNLITGQYPPTAGRILYRSEDISRLKPQARARLGFGRTFQISKTLVSLTTLENVLIGAFLKHAGVRDAADHAFRMLEMVGLAGRASIRAGNLTLSERRRLEIARALALEPSILLLDEVMAGLNHTEVDSVIHLVQTLHGRGYTVLVIEHNLKVVRAFASRVIVLDFGAKIADGTAESVLADERVVEAYVGKKRA